MTSTFSPRKVEGYGVSCHVAFLVFHAFTDFHVFMLLNLNSLCVFTYSHVFLIMWFSCYSGGGRGLRNNLFSFAVIPNCAWCYVKSANLFGSRHVEINELMFVVRPPLTPGPLWHNETCKRLPAPLYTLSYKRSPPRLPALHFMCVSISVQPL